MGCGWGGCVGCCNSHWVVWGLGVGGVCVWDAVTHTGWGRDGVGMGCVGGCCNSHWVGCGWGVGGVGV